MQELFNPSRLRMVEDKNGAISYGWMAPRVLYARFVGALSAELGSTFVRDLEALVKDVTTVAYFGDASALTQYDLSARLRFQRLIEADRSKFAALVFLTWAEGISPAARNFAGKFRDCVRILADPDEFERGLTSLVPLPSVFAPSPAPLWHLPAPR